MPALGGWRPPNFGLNFVCTNVPGVQVPQYLCGHRVLDTIGVLVLSGNIGLGITILSYNQALYFSFICEPRLLPDLEVLTNAAEAAYGELLARRERAREQARAQVAQPNRTSSASDEPSERATCRTSTQYPRTITLPDGKSVQLRLMTAADRNAMLAFARSLPQEDLLFLRVDITDPAAVDEWIRNIETGLSSTLLASDENGSSAMRPCTALARRGRERVGELRVNVGAGTARAASAVF